MQTVATEDFTQNKFTLRKNKFVKQAKNGRTPISSKFDLSVMRLVSILCVVVPIIGAARIAWLRAFVDGIWDPWLAMMFVGAVLIGEFLLLMFGALIASYIVSGKPIFQFEHPLLWPLTALRFVMWWLVRHTVLVMFGALMLALFALVAWTSMFNQVAFTAYFDALQNKSVSQVQQEILEKQIDRTQKFSAYREDANCISAHGCAGTSLEEINQELEQKENAFLASIGTTIAPASRGFAVVAGSIDQYLCKEGMTCDGFKSTDVILLTGIISGFMFLLGSLVAPSILRMFYHETEVDRWADAQTIRSIRNDFVAEKISTQPALSDLLTDLVGVVIRGTTERIGKFISVDSPKPLIEKKTEKQDLVETSSYSAIICPPSVMFENVLEKLEIPENEGGSAVHTEPYSEGTIKKGTELPENSVMGAPSHSQASEVVQESTDDSSRHVGKNQPAISDEDIIARAVDLREGGSELIGLKLMTEAHNQIIAERELKPHRLGPKRRQRILSAIDTK